MGGRGGDLVYRLLTLSSVPTTLQILQQKQRASLRGQCENS